MSTQQCFNFESEELKKERGIAMAASRHASEIELCRVAARSIAMVSGTADMERVRNVLSEFYPPIRWGNWCGAVFKDGEWEPTGEFVEVTHKGGHRRGGGSRVWRLKNGKR